MIRFAARLATAIPSHRMSIVRTPAALALATLGLALAPVSLAHLSTVHDPVMSRINVAFSAAAVLDRVGPAIAVKGDLPRRLGCAGQTWPAIDSACLTDAAGAPVRPARTVTVERRTGPQSSELMRVPAPVVALR